MTIFNSNKNLLFKLGSSIILLMSYHQPVTAIIRPVSFPLRERVVKHHDNDELKEKDIVTLFVTQFRNYPQHQYFYTGILSSFYDDMQEHQTKTTLTSCAKRAVGADIGMFICNQATIKFSTIFNSGQQELYIVNSNKDFSYQESYLYKFDYLNISRVSKKLFSKERELIKKCQSLQLVMTVELTDNSSEEVLPIHIGQTACSVLYATYEYQRLCLLPYRNIESITLSLELFNKCIKKKIAKYIVGRYLANSLRYTTIAASNWHSHFSLLIRHYIAGRDQFDDQVLIPLVLSPWIDQKVLIAIVLGELRKDKLDKKEYVNLFQYLLSLLGKKRILFFEPDDKKNKISILMAGKDNLERLSKGQCIILANSDSFEAQMMCSVPKENFKIRYLSDNKEVALEWHRWILAEDILSVKLWNKKEQLVISKSWLI